MLALLVSAALLAGAVEEASPASSLLVHLTADALPATEPAPLDRAPGQLSGRDVALETTTAGALVAPAARANEGAWAFDGQRSIVWWAPPSDAPAPFAETMTWEGFFLLPSTAECDADGSISDRLITQFAAEKTDSTRVTIGVSCPGKGLAPRLCVALAGSTNRHVGKHPIVTDAWHHFALVLRPVDGVPTLLWYLDYEETGRAAMKGDTPRTTLAPPSLAPLAIGARLVAAGKADRGFEGLLDELRLSVRPLEPKEFLRTRTEPVERLVEVDYFDGVASPFNWQLTGLEPRETLRHEALALAAMPQAYSLRGFAVDRAGLQVVRHRTRWTFPKGEVRLVMRAAADAVLRIDGLTVIDGRRPPADAPLASAEGQAERDLFVVWTSDGQPHDVELLAAYEAQAPLPRNTWEPDSNDSDKVAGAKAGGDAPAAFVLWSPAPAADAKEPPAWRLLGATSDAPFSPMAWTLYRGRTKVYLAGLDAERRAAAIERGGAFWTARHAWARELAEAWPSPTVPADAHPVDYLLEARIAASGDAKTPPLDDALFLRRLTLDVCGRIPTEAELREFLADPAPDKRTRAVDRLLASPEWAAGWVGYWQDVLGENPSILKPALNNSGPFRQWLHDSLAANVPFDRFAAELVMMEGRHDEGGTQGFAIAAANDSPMAVKAHVVSKAFLAVELQCARCHDAPMGDFAHRDLFSLAAMLGQQPITVPKESTVVVPPGGRVPAVSSNLRAGERVAPEWPLDGIVPDAALAGDPTPRALGGGPRAQLTATLLSPRRSRFSDVLVNRVWKRYLGLGLIEPVDAWEDRSAASHPELLDYLSREFVRSGYDLKALSRLVLTSAAYGRQVRPGDGGPIDYRRYTFAAPLQRRMQAEQLVDSLYLAVGKSFEAEELNFDPNKTQGFLNLGTPERAWQLASLSNERDRPALSLPVNMTIVDVLMTFGWRESRADPTSVRDEEPNPLQPLLLANGLMVQRVVRLSENNRFTAVALEANSVDELIDRLFLGLLSRKPDAAERRMFTELLGPGFAERKTGRPCPAPYVRKRAAPDWDRHLLPEASVEMMEAEKLVRAGDPPTVRLTDDYRQRVEDALWCLMNTAEFVFVP